MLSTALSQQAGGIFSLYGTPTIINGATVLALWRRAEPNRIQMLVNETIFEQPAWEVQLPAIALQPPVNVADGVTMIWQATGILAVVRGMELFDLQGQTAYLTVIAEQMSE